MLYVTSIITNMRIVYYTSLLFGYYILLLIVACMAVAPPHSYSARTFTEPSVRCCVYGCVCLCVCLCVFVHLCSCAFV